MDRTRKISEQMLQKHPDAFSTDFEKNKKALNELAQIPSKHLRNHIAGYITKALKEDVETDEEPESEETKE